MIFRTGDFYNPIPSNYITVATAAEVLGIREAEVIEKCRNGEIKAVYNPPFNNGQPCWFIEVDMNLPAGTMVTVV